MFMPTALRFCRKSSSRGPKLSIGSLCAAVFLAGSLTAQAQTSVPKPTEQDALEIGVRGYLFLYPLVTMDVTRRQMTNVERPEGLFAPTNVFVNVPSYPKADMKTVVRPN